MRVGYLVLLPVWCLLFASTSGWAGDALFDVSYLWHSRLESVLAYRNQVGRVLGPAVTKRLRVVRGTPLYGLIYHRQGDGATASWLVRKHSGLLKSQGLEPAVRILTKEWNFVSERQGARVSGRSGSLRTRSKKEQRNQNLEAAVEQYVKRLRRTGKIAADERTAWSVYDFTSGRKLVDINEDVQFQAASLVKPFFALAFFHEVIRGRLKYGSKSRRHLRRMIQNSNNSSTNWIIRQVGGPGAVQRLLKRHYSGIFQDTLIVEYIPPGGRTYRNKASVHDYSRFLYALWNDDLPRAREIKRLMALPGPDRLYSGNRVIPKGTKVYNKTGSTARLCGDMGILILKGKGGKRYPYTLVGVIEKRKRARSYTAWLRSRGNIIRRVSEIVYRGISQQHDLSGRL